MTKRTILLTGATGAIGRHVAVALSAAGLRVRGLSRDVSRARRLLPEIDWYECDLVRGAALRRSLEGTSAAVYLYHAIGQGDDYSEREAQVADAFRCAANESGIERIVYLGGVVPKAAPSRHLESRRRTGEILRQSHASTIELRASMVIGCGSQSFQMIRDLGVRMPVLLLPPWLDQRSCPVAICDVAAAIAVASCLPLKGSACFELPGPERISHRDMIGYVAEPLGTRIIESRIATITHSLAARGIALLSRVDPALSRELVFGLTDDLVPMGAVFWDQLGNPPLVPLRQAVVDALYDESAAVVPAPETRRRIETKTLDWLRRAGLTPAHSDLPPAAGARSHA